MDIIIKYTMNKQNKCKGFRYENRIKSINLWATNNTVLNTVIVL